MNILLTGSNGFLGKELYNHLIVTNTVFTLNRTNSNYNCDLSRGTIIFNNLFDVVIHAAGLAHIKANKQNNYLYTDINVNGTANLLNSLQKNIPKYFIYISSVSVYGLNEGVNIDEDEPLLANDPYGLSKILAEDKVIKWCNNNNVIFTILRLPLIVGNNPPGNLGSMINAIQKGYYFNISGGNFRKSMVLNTDIAGSILKISKVGGIYNLTDGVHPSIKELSIIISTKLGKTKLLNLPFIFAYLLALLGDILGSRFPINSNKLAKITSTLTFNDSKARATFGWEPIPVLKGIKLNNNE
jgi:nucleoside-diphosphate-sugar epimerase